MSNPEVRRAPPIVCSSYVVWPAPPSGRPFSFAPTESGDDELGMALPFPRQVDGDSGYDSVPDPLGAARGRSNPAVHMTAWIARHAPTGYARPGPKPGRHVPCHGATAARAPCTTGEAHQAGQGAYWRDPENPPDALDKYERFGQPAAGIGGVTQRARPWRSACMGYRQLPTNASEPIQRNLQRSLAGHLIVLSG